MPITDKDIPCVRAIHSCAKCTRPFKGKDSKESYIKHLEHSSKHKISKASVPESCGQCGRYFSSTRALIQHLKKSRHHLKDLHYAACTGKFQLVEKLMRNEMADSPGDSHQPSKPQMGFTPMHCAAFGGHEECLTIMLSWADGDPNVVDPKDGKTPVHLAAWKGNGNCLRLLLKKGGDINRPDCNGNTPMSLAKDRYCMYVVGYHLAAKQFKLIMEPLCDNLCRVNIAEVPTQIEGREEPRQAEEMSPSNIQDKSSEPYEVLARGELAVEIFNKALLEGKACVPRMQLTVIGDVGVGKTSLVRSLSGEDFVEEREETRGIVTSMVEMTELDESWHAVDLNNSIVDDILAEKVCQGIRGTPVKGQSNDSRGKQPGCSQSRQSFPPTNFRRLASIEGPSTSGGTGIRSNADETSMVNMSPSASPSLLFGDTPSRTMPVDQIKRKLSHPVGTSPNGSEKKYTKVSIWDFAGHSLYEAMHHVFLNRRSFYLVVLNLVRLCNPETVNQALEEIHFWLNSVRVHTPHTTPVFLVGTRRAEVANEDLASAESDLYDELVESFGQQLVNSKERSFLFPVENSLGGEDSGAIALRKAIENEAALLRKMEEELPVLWLHFEEEILKCRDHPLFPPCVRKINLKRMMEQNTSRVVEEREFDSMPHFYHDSGVIILPEELIGPTTYHSELNDLVVINPQYLVDVMTCLHDVTDHLDIDRRHRSQWKTLQEEGVADIELLKFLWEKFRSPIAELVGILEASGMLCPISASAEVKDHEDGTVPVEGDENSAQISKYIVPFHLKEKSLMRKWEKLCQKSWSGICTSDKLLVFDFRSFLPPALFNYFIVRTSARSKDSSGMKPIITKGMAIFSFEDSFFILTEMCQKHNQIRIRARYKNGKKLHKLFSILMSIMTDICQRQFRFLKFSFGPVCPNPRCPGSSSDGTVRRAETSSDESDEGDDDGECEGGGLVSSVHSPAEGVRRHVICIDPAVPSKPMWCNSTPVHEFEEIKQWFVEPQDGSSKVPEDSHCYSEQVQSCCLVVVAKQLANNWKWLGRALLVPNTTIQNIQVENSSENERSYQVLIHWEQTVGHKATVLELIKAIEEVGDVPTLEAFEQHLGDRHVNAADPGSFQ